MGARRLDSAFMKTLGEAPGMRAVLWLSPEAAFDRQGLHRQSGRAAQPAGAGHSVRIGNEAFLSKPLPPGFLLAASSLDEQLALERNILWIGLGAGGGRASAGCIARHVDDPAHHAAGGAACKRSQWPWRRANGLPACRFPPPMRSANWREPSIA